MERVPAVVSGHAGGAGFHDTQPAGRAGLSDRSPADQHPGTSANGPLCLLPCRDRRRPDDGPPASLPDAQRDDACSAPPWRDSVARYATAVSASRSAATNRAVQIGPTSFTLPSSPSTPSSHPAGAAIWRSSTQRWPACRRSIAARRSFEERGALAVIASAGRAGQSDPISRTKGRRVCARSTSPASPARKRFRTGCASILPVRPKSRRVRHAGVRIDRRRGRGIDRRSSVGSSARRSRRNTSRSRS